VVEHATQLPPPATYSTPVAQLTSPYVDDAEMSAHYDHVDNTPTLDTPMLVTPGNEMVDTKKQKRKAGTSNSVIRTSSVKDIKETYQSKLQTTKSRVQSKHVSSISSTAMMQSKLKFFSSKFTSPILKPKEEKTIVEDEALLQQEQVSNIYIADKPNYL
jgi:hypothetical protein